MTELFATIDHLVAVSGTLAALTAATIRPSTIGPLIDGFRSMRFRNASFTPTDRLTFAARTCSSPSSLAVSVAAAATAATITTTTLANAASS